MHEPLPVSHTNARRAGSLAATSQTSLRSYSVGALPIINRFLQRLELAEILERHLPCEDDRTKLATSTGILLLVRNVLLSREPIYGVADWASRHAPNLLGISEDQLDALNDDRLGRCLGGLFAKLGPELILDVVRQAMAQFHLQLDELHNDSTTISFYGNYPDAVREGLRQGRKTHAITWGAQQRPSSRPKATALHPDGHRGWGRAGLLHHRQRQRQ
jgi:hypothetical protein